MGSMPDFQESPVAWTLVLLYRIGKWSLYLALLVAWCSTSYCHNQVYEACQIVSLCD